MPDNTMPRPADTLAPFTEALKANWARWDRDQREHLTVHALQMLADLHYDRRDTSAETPFERFQERRDLAIAALLRATAKVVWNQTWYALCERTPQRERLRALLDEDPDLAALRDQAVAARLSEFHDGAQ